MYRHLYRVLFVMMAALAAVVLMRPTVVEELATLGKLGVANLLGQAYAAPPQQAPNDFSYPGGFPETGGPGDAMISAVRLASWTDVARANDPAEPGDPAELAESFVPDAPPSSRRPSRYNPPSGPTVNYPYREAGSPVYQRATTLAQRMPVPTRFPFEGPPPLPSYDRQPAAPSWPYQQPSAAPGAGPPAGPRGGEPAARPRPYPEAGSRLGSQAPTKPFDLSTANRPPDPPPAKLCENAQILARVGSQVILACEVLPVVDRVIEENKDKYPPSVLEEQRKLLTQKLLEQGIDMKLIFCDAQRSLPAETITNIKKQLGEQFEKKEIPQRLKKAGLGSRRELQEELEKIGSSLEHEKRSFIERAVAQQWIFQQISDDKEITLEEILDYYHQRPEEFERKARARWEQLSVRFSHHPDPRQARALIAQMGNDVIRGIPFVDVSREHSEGATARDGGARDWTIQGSLRSEVLDRALFGLPIGRLSPILEDQKGFHIVRVVQREDAGRTPFHEAQVQIKEKLRLAHRKEQMEAFTKRLKGEIPVWTIFDDQTADRRSSAAFGSSTQR